MTREEEAKYNKGDKLLYCNQLEVMVLSSELTLGGNPEKEYWVYKVVDNNGNDFLFFEDTLSFINQEPTLSSDVEEAIERIENNVIDYKITYEYKQQIQDFNTIKQVLNDNQSKLNAIEEVVKDRLWHINESIEYHTHLIKLNNQTYEDKTISRFMISQLNIEKKELNKMKQIIGGTK